MNKALIFSVLVFLVSCGDKKSDKESPKKEANKLELEMYGSYKAVLYPVNKSLVPKIYGSFTFARDKNKLVAHVRVSQGPGLTLHAQHLHTGSRCPTPNDDINLDGVIDSEEGALVYKDIIVPLNGDLNSQRMGGGIFPFSDEFGHYEYSQVAEYDRFLQDLHEIDLNPYDNLVKLNPEKGMRPSGKVVVIYGIPSDVELPETVVGSGRLSKHEALPIACGVINKVVSVPGTVDEDDSIVSLPHGETIGGSGGGNDGADFPPIPISMGNGNYGED